MTMILKSRSSRVPGVEELENDPGYRLILELDFNEMIPFVLDNIRRKSYISFLYAAVNILLFVAAVLWIVIGIAGSQISWLSVFKQSLAGLFTGSILIIPIHELLHGLAYKVLGAKKVEFGADMQQLIFFATADRYPVSGKELYFLAMTPFVLINLAIAVIFLVWFPHLSLYPLFLLLSHNIMCIGDFAMVNYVHHINSMVYTYDVKENKKSFFYEKIDGGEN